MQANTSLQNSFEAVYYSLASILLAGMTAGLLHCGGGGGVDLQEVETCTSLVLVGPGR